MKRLTAYLAATSLAAWPTPIAGENLSPIDPDFLGDCLNVLHHGRWLLAEDEEEFEFLERNSPAQNLRRISRRQATEMRHQATAKLEPDQFDKNTTTGVTLAGNAQMTWSGPDSCNYKVYQPNEIKRCLKRHYSRIQFIGDSRARQYFSALKPLITENNQTRKFVMFDSSWQLPQENRLDAGGIVLDQAWVRKSVQGWGHVGSLAPTSDKRISRMMLGSL